MAAAHSVGHRRPSAEVIPPTIISTRDEDISPTSVLEALDSPRPLAAVPLAEDPCRPIPQRILPLIHPRTELVQRVARIFFSAHNSLYASITSMEWLFSQGIVRPNNARSGLNPQKKGVRLEKSNALLKEKQSCNSIPSFILFGRKTPSFR